MDDPSTAGFDTGFDFGTGFGFIQADKALQSISIPTVANVIAPQSATVSQAFNFTVPANTFSDPNGDALTVSVTGLPAGLSASGSIISGTPSMSGVSIVTVTATDPGSLSVSTTFQLTVNPAMVVMPPAGPFSITGVTTVSCTTLSAGQWQISFTPLYGGTTGQPITFRVVNELSPTTAPGPYTLNPYTDNPVFTLKATQNGTAGEASFTYNWLAACNGGARLAALPGREFTAPLTVSLYPNPVGEEFAIGIQGAQGQTVRIMLTDLSGRSLTNTLVDVTTADQREQLRFGNQRSGLYLLRVSTAQQAVTLKVIKQ